MARVKEIWKDIPGFEGLYQASTLGRIKSLDRVVFSKRCADNKMNMKSRIMSGSQDSHGYLFNILSKNGKQFFDKTHRWILLTFIGKSKLHADHINGVRDDNRLSNLRYCTRRMNNIYSSKRRSDKSTSIYNSKYTGVFKSISTNGAISFRACIVINWKRTYLGTFKSEIKAHRVYQAALKKIEYIDLTKSNIKYSER